MHLFNDVATALFRGVDSLLVLLAALVLLATIAWLYWLMVSDRLGVGGTDHTEVGRQEPCVARCANSKPSACPGRAGQS